MSDTTTSAAPLENVGRGVTFALLAVPAAVIVFAILGGVFNVIWGIAAIVVPYIAAGLYQKGAGTQLTRAGWGPWVGVTAVAVIVGTFTGVVAATLRNYKGSGGILSPVFLRTLGNQFTVDFGDNALAILIGLGLGAVGIAAVLRGPRTPANRTAVAPANPVAPPPAVPTPPAANQPSANQPSAGIMLNGKPVDPDPKKKK